MKVYFLWAINKAQFQILLFLASSCKQKSIMVHLVCYWQHWHYYLLINFHKRVFESSENRKCLKIKKYESASKITSAFCFHKMKKTKKIFIFKYPEPCDHPVSMVHAQTSQMRRYALLQSNQSSGFKESQPSFKRSRHVLRKRAFSVHLKASSST